MRAPEDPTQSDDVYQRRLAIAAALGSKASITTGIKPATLNDHYRTRIEEIAINLTARQCIEFSFECSLRAVTVWEVKVPMDPRPRQAVEAVRAWLAGDRNMDFQNLCDAAARAGFDVDYPELTEDIDADLVAAMEAASTCSHLALAVHSHTSHEGQEELCAITAWIARGAVKSAIDRAQETQRQSSSLILKLLE